MVQRKRRQEATSDLRRPRDTFAGTIINVRDLGAKGDGSADDTAALEAAIDASIEGDALYFPAGTYLVGRPLELKVRQLVFSLTDRAVVKARAKTGFPLFILRSGAAEFLRLSIDGAREESEEPSDPAPGIWRPFDAGGAVDVVVSSCRIRNTHGDGIRIQGGSDSERASDRVIVRETIVEHCGMNGLSIGRVDNVRVESSRFARCHSGIKVLDGHDVVVHAVTVNENRRHGIVFTFSHDFHVDGCIARGNGSDGGWGIAAGGEPIDGLEPNSDFTITNNVCESNGDGGITLDPTTKPEEGKPEVIWPQRARVSGNVCRNATNHHGIHLTHASDVVVTDNVCTRNAKGSGIQLVSSAHVLVQGNTCFANRNGIGLFAEKNITAPGHHVIGINMLYSNDCNVRHQQSGEGQPLIGVRIHGLHGERRPDGNVQAEPGTLYEHHDGDQGALYVKETGSGTAGWVRAASGATPAG